MSHLTDAGLKRRRGRLSRLTVAAAVLISAATAAPASADTVGFSGSRAYGANAKLVHPTLPDPTLGNVATQQLPCVPRSGTTYTNQVAQVMLGSKSSSANPVLSTGTVVNSGVATFDLADPASAISVVERSQAETVRIIHNAITNTNVVAADAVDVKAQVTRNADGSVHTKGSTALVGIKVLGIARSETPAANTTIPLDLSGSKVVLNEQEAIRNSSGVVIGIKVTGIHVKLINFLGYTGDIRVGVAMASITPAIARLEASAYALRAQVGSTATVGRQNLLVLPCSGTGGIERSQAGVGLTQTGIGSVELPLSVVNGKLVKSPFTTYDYAISRTAQVNLLGGAITADAITSVSRTARTSSGVSSVAEVPASPATPSSGTATSLVNLVINGQLISASVAPNTKLDLPGIGRVTLNRQRCSRNGSSFRETTASSPTCAASRETRFEVIAVVIEVTDPTNVMGLALGTTIEVAAAISGVSD